MFLLIVTLTSMLLAAIMSVIAWRIAGDERRRSEARVVALSAEIHDAVPARIAIVAQTGASRCVDTGILAEVPRPQPVPRASRQWDQELELRPAGLAAVNAGAASAYTELFVAQQAPSGWRPFAVLAGGALVFGAAVAMAILLGGRFSRAPRSANPVLMAAPVALPLELVALGHERVGDQLTVRGVVRNPASGAGMDRLTAVVFLFTSDGGFVASGRAAVESPLRPGSESTFVVTLPGAGDVGRYRVSFRIDDRLVPHLDRRHERS
jgi:hypothetical protein